MITPSAPLAGTSSSDVTANDLFLMLITLFSDRRPMPAEQELRVALDQHGAAGQVGIDALDLPVVERQHVVLDRLDQPQPLELVQLLRHLLGQVVGLGPVLAAVVELPDIVVEGGHLLPPHLPRRAVLGHRAPALVVDAPVAEHLEVLGLVPLGGLGVGEAVDHAGALVGALQHAVDHSRLGKARRLEHGGRNVDHVAELVARWHPCP